MGHLRQDLRHALRMMRRQPLASALAIVTLALGVGATTAIFSAVQATLLRPLPYPRAERLVSASVQLRDSPRGVMLSPLFSVWRTRTTQLDALAAWRPVSWWLTGRGSEPRAIEGAQVSREMFAVLGVQPMLGRGFLASEEQPVAAAPASAAGTTTAATAARATATVAAGAAAAAPPPRPIVISHRLWRTQLGADRAVLGRTLTLSERPYTIVGIMPAGFTFPGLAEADLFAPLVLPAPDDASAMVWFVDAIGRMKADATAAHVRTELDTLLQRIARPRTGLVSPMAVKMLAGALPRAEPLQDLVVRESRGILWLLFGAVGCVLLIACANVANLQLARAIGRRREVAVRAALGAGRRRLVAQLATESLLLAALGALLALPIAAIGIALLRTTPALRIPRPEQLALDGVVLTFALALATLTALLAGIAPALSVTRDLQTPLQSASARGGDARPLARARALLLVAEIAAACMLLVGAGLLTRSLVALASTDPGFTASTRVLTMQVMPRRRYAEETQVRAYFDQLLETLRAAPGVQAAGLTSGLPLQGFSMAVPLARDGEAAPAEGVERPPVPMDIVTEDYFTAMGIPLLAGRGFSSADRATAPPVAIVNAALARQLFPGGDALGQRLRVLSSPEDPPLTIVGIVGNVRQLGLARVPDAAFFRPFAQQDRRAMSVVVRVTAPDAASLTPLIVDAARAIDRDQPIDDVRTMAARVETQLATPRTNTRLLGLFALLAIGLAAIGLYGVMAHTVSTRVREMGLRLALGARPVDVERLMLRQALRLGVCGVALGLGGAFAASRIIERFLYGVRPLDPITWIAVPVLVLTVVLLAAYGPSRRAAATDPMVALRVE